MKAVIDNDILYKGSCYGLLQDVAMALDAKPSECGVLGAARFVLRDKIRRAKLSQDKKLASQVLESFLRSTLVVETSENEQMIAAELESTALRLGVSLDAGESQLCAVAIHRAVPLLATGDKRAIAALEMIIDSDTHLLALCAKIVCLEQLILRIMTRVGFGDLRAAVCREPDADKVIAICFSCRSAVSSESATREGLHSYLRDLRSVAARMLS